MREWVQAERYEELQKAFGNFTCSGVERRSKDRWRWCMVMISPIPVIEKL